MRGIHQSDKPMRRSPARRVCSAATMRVVVASAALTVHLAVPNALVAQSQVKRALAIEDFYRLKTVGASEISPDGKWVSFTVSTRVEETNGTSTATWLAPTSGATAARLVSMLGVPSWNADGTLRFTAGGRTMRVNPLAPDRVDTASAPATPPRSAPLPGPALVTKNVMFDCCACADAVAA